MLAAIGGVAAVPPLGQALGYSDTQAMGSVVFATAMVVVASLISAAHVLVFVLGLRAPAGPGDRVDALLTRVAGPQLPFSVGIAGVQALALLLIGGLPYVKRPESFQLCVAGVFSVALVLCRRSPPLALTLAWVAVALQMSAQLAPGPGDLAILAVLFCTGASESRRVRIAGAVSAVLGAVIAVAYLTLTFNLLKGRSDSVLLAGVVFGGILAMLGLSWTIGLLSRAVRRAREGQTLRAQAEQERARAQRELDTVEERNRIARDMHDVVAHSLAVVIAQSDGARYLGASSPEQTDAALLTISSVARDALADVRVLLAQLRHSQSDGPQPGAADLPALLGSVGGAGTPVRADLAVDLEAVPRAVGLALYRIAQEATTNALRHGRPGSAITVSLCRSGDELVLTVRNARRLEDERDALPGEGHGLVGMRERATLVGGALSAGPVGEDFVVHARLPATALLARESSATSPLASGGIPA
ncbi:sensor histidine kinase [Rathayibacter iranicus]|uniref:histidine kinase n=1 Tax=Rathayibacter iranicus TaxID=59737 RepID=A0AAD1ELY2_9MICO|nr:sensor histidine kinase [Rathayibacter iranicus]PPI48242.1 sensor histidine kinase [Rathayibacter iranicus]PPI60873.1 sensor histidine kinase [Rathayibacter iranicus]PPI72599.1 sensor histidine kinase [Rathayibacter iranicus]